MWKRKSSRGWEFHQPLRHIFESHCFLNVCYSVQSFIFLFSVFHALSQIFFYLLKTSLTLWSMLLAYSPTHWSCKGWRNSSNMQEAALDNFFVTISHSKSYIFLEAGPWAWWIQLWVARWTFCCCSCFTEDTFTWNRVDRKTAENV